MTTENKNLNMIRSLLIKKGYKNPIYLGSGTYGFVFYDDNNGMPVAIKVVSSNIYDPEIFFMDIYPKTKYLVNNYGLVYLSPLYDALLLEYMNMGDLSNVFSNLAIENKCMPEIEILNCMKCCLGGLKFLHDNGYAHLDIKPANILVSKNEFDVLCTYKLADFGFICSEKKGWKCSAGTALYTPPSILQLGENYYDIEISLEEAKSVDIWGMGVTFWSLIKPSELFFFPHVNKQYRYYNSDIHTLKFLSERTQSDFMVLDSKNQVINEIINSMVRVDKNERANIDFLYTKIMSIYPFGNYIATYYNFMKPKFDITEPVKIYQDSKIEEIQQNRYLCFVPKDKELQENDGLTIKTTSELLTDKIIFRLIELYDNGILFFNGIVKLKNTKILVYSQETEDMEYDRWIDVMLSMFGNIDGINVEI